MLAVHGLPTTPAAGDSPLDGHPAAARDSRDPSHTFAIGSTFRRRSCRDRHTGRSLGSACPKLSSRRHGKVVITVP
jgi:hypothetical protein